MRAVLVLGGAFNPVHTGHTALMTLVKSVVEARDQIAIVAGYLAVAPDGYVRRKLAHQAMKSVHRLAACNLAMQGHDWLVPCDRPDGSALECGLRRRREDDIHTLVVVGADRAMGRPENAKWRRPAKDRVVTVCVGRAGETERVLACYEADVRANLVPDPRSFLFVTEEVGAVSSTAVRAELRRLHDAAPTEKPDVARRMVDVGLLHAPVAGYILENETDLYLDPRSNGRRT